MKDKAAQLTGGLFYACLGLFLFGFGIYFFSAKSDEKSEETSFTHRTIILEDLVTKAGFTPGSFGIVVNHYLRAQGCDTLFYFSEHGARKKLGEFTGHPLEVGYAYIDSLNCYRAYTVRAGAQQLIPMESREENEYPLRGFGIFIVITGLVIFSVSVYLLSRVYRHMRASARFAKRVTHEYVKTQKLNQHEMLALENELSNLHGTFAKNLLIGVIILIAALIVPFKYTSFSNYRNYKNDEAGKETLVQKLGGPAFILVTAGLAALFIYMLRNDTRKVKKDLAKMQKVALRGRVAAVEKKEKEPDLVLVTIKAENLLIDSLERQRTEGFSEGNEVELDVTVHAQFVLSLKKLQIPPHEQHLFPPN